MKDAMKDALSKAKFIEVMNKDECNPFSDAALEIIFDYLTKIESEIGFDLAFDPEAFRSTFVERTYKDVLTRYDIVYEYEEIASDEEEEQITLEFLSEHTTVLGTTKHRTVVYKVFKFIMRYFCQDIVLMVDGNQEPMRLKII
jgi:hypothetical protein